MYLKSVEIHGFRSLEDVSWRPGNLNVVIGPNATGKSNLLQWFRFIAASARGTLQDYIYSAGGMGSLVFGHGPGMIDMQLVAVTNDQPDLRYEFAASRLGPGPSYALSWEYVILAPDTEAAQKVIRRSGHNVAVGQGRPKREAQLLVSAVKDSETALSLREFDLQGFNQVIEFRNSVRSWHVVTEIRTDKSSAVRQAAVSRVAQSLEDDCANLVPFLHTHYTNDLEFRRGIDDAMAAAFGEIYKELAFPPGAQQQVQLAVRWSFLPTPEPASELSDGTIRFLAIIAALCQPEPPALLAIDEPEVGLHPSMMRIITEYAASAALRSLVVFTTHSVTFLDSFDREDSPTVTIASIEDGRTRLASPDKQTLARWLSDYSLGTLYDRGELEILAEVVPA